MTLLESLLALWGTAVGTGSAAKDLYDYLKNQATLEQVLASLVQEAFSQQLPRLQHLCKGGDPVFHRDEFVRALQKKEITISDPNELLPILLPILEPTISTPGATCGQEDIRPVYESILSSALRGMWKAIGNSQSLTNQILLAQQGQLMQAAKDAPNVQQLNESVKQGIASFAQFALDVRQQIYDKLLDVAPPPTHTIDKQTHINPFLLARAEDFNHNYEKLAKLFQGSPDWESIQRRTDNVFIEGTRGTGKSMLLRRLTAQATIAATRIQNPHATFDDLKEDYFCVYVKLTRGYYDQFISVDTVNINVSSQLAQHELNIEIFDAFVDTLRWLLASRALPNLYVEQDQTIRDLASLFPNCKQVYTLEDLQHVTVRYEQDQIIEYYRQMAFNRPADYKGSATDTVNFMRRLSGVFRQRLFPKREMRLFLLLDEFETLIEIQQIAVNTVAKMRLPDLSLKVAVRKSGRKTSNTFTPGDPIQDPRDYTHFALDYDAKTPQYAELLEGIASKRLKDAGYGEHNIRLYLSPQSPTEEVSQEQLEAELQAIWTQGQRRTSAINKEFREKYAVAATYRILAKGGKRKSFTGCDAYVQLSSGIVSNFIELCKYAFFYALSDQIPLRVKPTIPSYHQTDAAYYVSQRLLSTIDGNVPIVGSILSRLLTDIGAILRQRLLNHSSEPEANRLAIADYDKLSDSDNKLIAEVMDNAIVWSVLHIEATGESFKPKNLSRPPSADLIINRIYCPALGISHRSRWPVRLTVIDLKNLIETSQREKTYQRLMRAIGVDQAESDLLGLYPSETT